MTKKKKPNADRTDFCGFGGLRIRRIPFNPPHPRVGFFFSLDRRCNLGALAKNPSCFRDAEEDVSLT
jgi:hypothetical protein